MAFRYNKYGVIVSIDFGTTFSGTCYAITGKFTQKELKNESYVKITHVTDWPQQNRSQHKTPSINIYDRNFHLLYWGREAFDIIKKREVKNDQTVMEKFKLNLPSSVAQKGAIHQTGNTTNKELMNMRATIDYFREIYDHTVSTIQKANNGVLKIEKEDIRFVITVPAQWNDVQRAIMRNVAKESGLISDEDHENRLLIINESLAATLYCERKHVDLTPEEALHAAAEEEDLRQKYGNGLETNDKYMICDAGGGTVDLATFESTDSGKSDENDSFRRCQLTADSGYKCGSVFLDQQMQKLLLNIFFSLEEPKNQKEKDEQKKYESLIAPYMDQFIDNLKLTFGTRRIGGYKEYEEMFCTHHESSSDSDSSDDEDESEEECEQCKKDEYKYIEDDRFGDDVTFLINGGAIENYLRLNYDKKGVDIKDNKDNGEHKICISYRLMREVVFDQVIESTLDLLKRQIDKANGNIKRTYLVGGFGCSPYLQKRVQKHFTNEETGECAVGQLVIDTRGNTAAMRGALYYGIDGSRRDPQSDIVEIEFRTSKDEFNTLVCIDIGYNGTACSYKDLNDVSADMTEIIQWPGLKEDGFLIPTALDTSEGKSLWGAQVPQTTNLDPETLIVPSKLMAIVKGDLRIYMSEYLKLLHNHVHGVISKESPHLTDKSKYRYVITMENCYQFFNRKSDMRHIAISAGIVNKVDSVERLLLIRREDAAAMYYEQKYFADTSEPKAYSNHFVQINMYHDTCHLALHEATKITGYNQDAFDKDANAKEIETKYFRNVRSMRSATLDFNFINRIVANLDSFVSKTVCISCSASKPHDTYNPEYYTGLREGFLDYIKNTLDFSNNDKDQLITITKSGCCVISITVYDLLEHVFRPAIRDLASEINRFATQVDMAQRFSFDKIFVSGILVDALPNTYSFIERILTKNLSEVMNILSDIITPSEDNGKEALLGAAHYGHHPEDFTERVSRKSYIVNVRAFAPREFSQAVKNELAKLKTKNEKYDLEAMNALIDETQEVELQHQLAYNPSRKDDSLKRGPNQATFLIHRGDKITEKDQMQGISKKFYAERECIVYATIYTSEETDLPEDEVNVDLSKFQKIHQFEIYIKRDADDPMTAAPNSRLHFDVRVIPDNNEAKLEANVCSRLGKKIPEFRFRDEILVANIYGDEQQIKVGDLTVDANTAAVESTGIGSSQ